MQNIFECQNCPLEVGDTIDRDCGFPQCCGWTITLDPKPIPDRNHDFSFVHCEFDYAEDTCSNGLCGTASSYDDAVDQIAEIMEGW